MSEAPETDDHADMFDAVRSAMETHADSETEPPHSSEARIEHQREADQSSIDMGLAVAAQLNAEDRHRGEQSKQIRDARGRFSAATSTGEADSVHDAAGALHVPEAPAAPPSSWSADAKALFNDLPQPIRDAIAKRETEVSRGFEDYRNRTERHADIENVIAPRRQYLAEFGFRNDAEAVNHLLTISDGFRANPAGTLNFLATQMGIRPEQIFPGLQSGPQVEAVVEQRVQQRLAEAEVARFEKAAPEHYGLVKGLMSQLLQGGAASTMQDAYRQACQHHPAVQSIEGQRRDRERRDRQIRAASASLSGAPHGVAATPPRSNGKSSGGRFGDIADDVRAAMAALS
jgi:hypothetical protein